MIKEIRAFRNSYSEVLRTVVEPLHGILDSSSSSVEEDNFSQVGSEDESECRDSCYVEEWEVRRERL